MDGYNDIFYVGVKEPVELRKNILEASKDVISLMKQHEHITELKKKRVEKINQLKETCREITKLANRLRAMLPSTESIAKSSEKEVEKIKKEMTPREKELMKKKEKIEKMPEAKAVSEVKRLEKELADIENKLKMISK